MLKKLLLMIVLVLGLNAQKVVLTEDEKKFLKENPVIKLGGGAGFEPFLIQNKDGTVSGYDVDIAEVITKNTGLKIEFVLGDWSQIQKQASSRDLDGLSTSIVTNERDKIYNASQAYLTLTPLVITKAGNPNNLLTIKDLKNKKVAIQNANKFQIQLAKSIKNIEIVYYESINDILKAVVSEKVDFAINDATAFYKANEIGLDSLIESPFIIGEETKFVFYLRNDIPELVSIINKGLDAISKKEFLEISKTWFNLNFNKSQNKLLYTQEEQEYFQNKKELKLCIDPNWLPFSKYEEGRRYGIGPDIYELIEKRIPIPITHIKTKDWSDSLEYMKTKQCDIVDFAIKTPQRAEYLNFTESFLDLPIVIITKVDVAFIYNFYELKDRVLAIPKNYAYIELLKSKYPFLSIKEVNNVQEGLSGVKGGSYFGYVGTLASTAYAIKENYTGELKVTGRFDENYEMGSGVVKEDLILLGIMNKVIQDIQPEDIHTIVNKWIHLQYEKGFDYTLFWKLMLFVLFFFMLFLYKNYILKKRVNEEIEKSRKKDNLIFQQYKMVSLGEMVGNIAHQWRQPLAHLSMTQNYIIQKLSSIDNAPNDLIQELHNAQESVKFMSKTIDIFESIYITSNESKETQFKIMEAIEKSLGFLEDTIKFNSIDVKLDIDQKYILKGDVNTIVHVLISILNNSIYFFKSRKIDKPIIEISLENSVDTLVLKIKDNAGGIQLEDINKVFEYGFSQRDDDSNSTGLGLYIARLIITEKFNGDIQVSNKDLGAEFKILFQEYNHESV